MGKSTISMAIFNSKLFVCQRVPAYLSDIDLFRLFGMVLGVPLPRLAKWLIRIDPPIGIAFTV